MDQLTGGAYPQAAARLAREAGGAPSEPPLLSGSCGRELGSATRYSRDPQSCRTEMIRPVVPFAELKKWLVGEGRPFDLVGGGREGAHRRRGRVRSRAGGRYTPPTCPRRSGRSRHPKLLSGSESRISNRHATGDAAWLMHCERPMSRNGDAVGPANSRPLGQRPIRMVRIAKVLYRSPHHSPIMRRTRSGSTASGEVGIDSQARR